MQAGFKFVIESKISWKTTKLALFKNEAKKIVTSHKTIFTWCFHWSKNRPLTVNKATLHGWFLFLQKFDLLGSNRSRELGLAFRQLKFHELNWELRIELKICTNSASDLTNHFAQQQASLLLFSAVASALAGQLSFYKIVTDRKCVDLNFCLHFFSGKG